jgi:hypothetical protein
MCAGCPSTTVFFSSSLETALLNARARASLSYVNLHRLLPSLYPDHHSTLTDNSPYSISRLLYYNLASPFSLYFGTPRPSRDYIMMSDYNHQLPVEINDMRTVAKVRLDYSPPRQQTMEWRCRILALAGVYSSPRHIEPDKREFRSTSHLRTLWIPDNVKMLDIRATKGTFSAAFPGWLNPTDLVTLLKGLETLFVSSMDSVCQCWSHRLSWRNSARVARWHAQ